MTTHYLANIKVIEHKFAHLVNRIADDTTADVQWDRDEHVTNQTSLHAWLQAASHLIGGSKHVLVFGIGLGSHIRLLLAHFPMTWFYIYEPDTVCFQAVLKHENLSDMFMHPNVKAIAMGDSLDQKRQLLFPICTFAQTEFALVPSLYYLNRPESVHSFKQQMPEIFNEYLVNQSTRHRFGDEWMRNRLNHISTNMTTPSIYQLKDRFINVPAIVIGSGPSLEEDISLLNELSKHCLLIAAGSSVQALLHHQISPHLVVVADGGAVVEQVFRSLESQQLPLLYTSTSNYKVTDIVRGIKLHIFEDTDAVTPYHLELGEEEPLFASAASVTGIAIQAAAYMGCRKIILAGQDLSFPQDKLYSIGVEHLSSAARHNVVQSGDIQIENVQGSTNRTTLPYKVLLQNIEEIISGFGEHEFINTTRYGARIKGTTFQPMDELYSSVKGLTEVSKDVIEIVLGDFDQGHRIQQAVFEKTSATITELSTYQRELNDLKKKIRKLPELSRTNAAKCSKQLMSVEEEWSKVVNRSSFNVFFESLLPYELQYFDSHLPNIVQESNLIVKCKLIETYLLKIIQELLNVIPLLHDLYRVAIDRLERILTSSEEVQM